MRVSLVSTVLAATLALTACGEDSSSSGSGASGGSGGSGAQGGGQTTGAGGGLTLDLDFGTEGVARASRAWSTDDIYAAGWSADGSLLLAGITGASAWQPDALLMRLSPSGAIDTTFGNEGVFLLPLGDHPSITSIAPLPDGGVLVAGVSLRLVEATAFVARVDAQGQLDTTFGEGGLTLFPGSYVDRVVRLARSEAGQIAVAAPGEDDLALWRLTEDGQIDSGFGDAGQVLLPGDLPRDLVFQPDGKLLVLVGGTSSGDLRRLAEDGSLDSTFGSGGTIDLTFEAFDLDLNDTGDILVAGGESAGYLLKLAPTGVPDPAFGNNGIANVGLEDTLTAATWLSTGEIILIDALIAAEPSTLFRGIQKVTAAGASAPFDDATTYQLLWLNGSVPAVLEKDGDVFLAGMRYADKTTGASEAMVLALDGEGAPVSSFGVDGLAQHGSSAAPEVLWDMALAPDGSPVAMGAASISGALARFTDGSPDPTFGEGGLAISPDIEIGNGVAVDAEGRILTTSLGYTLIRYTPEGLRDTTFGAQGIATIMQGNGIVVDVVLDAEQRILVTGEVVNEGALVARLLEDGSLDSTFGDGGVVAGAAGAAGYAGALLVAPDGKLVIAGQSSFSASYVGRLLEDGSPDPSFGMEGRAAIPIAIRLFRLEPRKQGGYLVAGSDASCLSEPTCPLIVAAVTAAGELDADFGEAGLARIEEARYFQAWTALAELPGGAIAVGGAIENEGVDQLAVWRLMPNGKLDSGFGDSGRFTLPGRGRATQAVVDGDGLLVGGWNSHPRTGTDMVLLRFAF